MVFLINHPRLAQNTNRAPGHGQVKRRRHSDATRDFVLFILKIIFCHNAYQVLYYKVLLMVLTLLDDRLTVANRMVSCCFAVTIMDWPVHSILGHSEMKKEKQKFNEMNITREQKAK